MHLPGELLEEVNSKIKTYALLLLVDDGSQDEILLKALLFINSVSVTKEGKSRPIRWGWFINIDL